MTGIFNLTLSDTTSPQTSEILGKVVNCPLHGPTWQSWLTLAQPHFHVIVNACKAQVIADLSTYICKAWAVWILLLTGLDVKADIALTRILNRWSLLYCLLGAYRHWSWSRNRHKAPSFKRRAPACWKHWMQNLQSELSYVPMGLREPGTMAYLLMHTALWRQHGSIPADQGICCLTLEQQADTGLHPYMPLLVTTITCLQGSVPPCAQSCWRVYQTAADLWAWTSCLFLMRIFSRQCPQRLQSIISTLLVWASKCHYHLFKIYLSLDRPFSSPGSSLLSINNRQTKLSYLMRLQWAMYGKIPRVECKMWKLSLQ